LVYIWHALTGYWGELFPTSNALQKYNPRIGYPVQSPANLSHIICITIDRKERSGIEFILPSKIYEFYNDLHGCLASYGLDEVKVDVQNIVETLGAGYGGRVSLMIFE
jgi:hypothetical protein